MRWLVLLLALGGAAASALVGSAIWSNRNANLQQLKKGRDAIDLVKGLNAAGANAVTLQQLQEAEDELRALERHMNAGLFAFASVALAVLGGFLALGRHKFSAAALLAAAGAGPGILAVKTLAFT